MWNSLIRLKSVYNVLPVCGPGIRDFFGVFFLFFLFKSVFRAHKVV